MTLHEAIKQLVENEKIYCATLRRACWHPRVTVWFELTLGKDSSHLFKKIVLEKEDDEEDFNTWHPSVDDILADDWIIKSAEEF